MKTNDKKTHFYTGNGKGKTTAAIGLAIRAAGAGMKVYFAQFVKGMKYSEYDLLNNIENIEVHLFGTECFINKTPEKEDVLAAQNGLKTVADIVRSEKYDMVILDEIFIALYYKLVDQQQLIDLLTSKPPSVELVLTGRYAPKELYHLADLITEMEEVKHYYNDGVLSRKGIDC
ncbi:MAG: cob(I)yrinic acid a,c-diamide adenosyltransferase [Bacteroidales bacterium]